MNDSLSAFSAFVQALTGIAALVLSIVVALQSKKIKELEDIATKLTDLISEQKAQTTELSKQSSTFEKRLNLEKSLSIVNRMPVFEKISCNPDYEGCRYIIRLYNIGKMAYNISVTQEKETDHIYKLITSATSTTAINTGLPLEIIVTYTSREMMYNHEFRFTLTTRNSNGHQVKQHITQIFRTADFIVTDPDDYL